jgi:glycolate oxidase FAD binding subunit
LRLAVPVSLLSDAVRVLCERLGDAVVVSGSAGVGVVHAGVAPGVPVDEVAAAVRGVRALLSGTGGTCVVVTAPLSTMQAIDMWGPVAGIGLMRRVKAQFDPAGRFAAGRFVGGL